MIGEMILNFRDEKKIRIRLKRKELLLKRVRLKRRGRCRMVKGVILLEMLRLLKKL